MQFPYRGLQMNLLDTPGHADFSEDTYRTLHAVDGAVMLLDCAKGVEAQTKKLFRVCKQRKMPIFTFVNKMDRPGREPFELIGEVENVLGIGVYPMTWPIFRGATSSAASITGSRKPVYLFDAEHAKSSAAHGAEIAAVKVSGLDDPMLEEQLGPRGYKQLRDEVELLDAAGDAFDREALRGGRRLADVLRQRHQQLRPRGVPRELLRADAARRRRARRATAPSPPTTTLQRVRLQDPGEHGPGAPRSHRVPARLLGPLRARHEGEARAHGARDPPREPDAVPGAGAQHRRRGLRGRRARRLRSGHLRDRRHAHRRPRLPVRGDPELRARALRAPRHGRPDEAQAAQEGARAARAGRHHPALSPAGGARGRRRSSARSVGSSSRS